MADQKRYLIVGGAVGIGKATAARLREHRLILAGRSRLNLEAAQAELGAGVAIETVDFTDPAAVAALAERVGAIDGLVLSASSSVSFGQFVGMSLEAARAGFDNKFWGYWLVTQAFLPHLAADGAVAMVAGAAGRAAMPGSAAVAAVNAAIEAVAKVLSIELAPRRFNVVSPGLTDTEAYAGLPADRRAAFFADTAKRLPAGRIGRPEDIAPLVVEALTNPFMTGAVLDIDGGVSLTRA